MPGTKIYYISGAGGHRARVGLSFEGQPITASSQPILDGWGWGTFWGCAEWKAWHGELLKGNSPAVAAAIFTQAWNSQSSDMNPYNWCKYDSSFRNYMRQWGIDVDSIVSALIMPVFDAAGNLVQGASTVVSNTASAASTLSTIVKYAIPVALVGGALYLATNSGARKTATSYAKRAISGTKKRGR